MRDRTVEKLLTWFRPHADGDSRARSRWAFAADDVGRIFFRPNLKASAPAGNVPILCSWLFDVDTSSITTVVAPLIDQRSTAASPGGQLPEAEPQIETPRTSAFLFVCTSRGRLDRGWALPEVPAQVSNVARSVACWVSSVLPPGSATCLPMARQRIRVSSFPATFRPRLCIVVPQWDLGLQ